MTWARFEDYADGEETPEGIRTVGSGEMKRGRTDFAKNREIAIMENILFQEASKVDDKAILDGDAIDKLVKNKCKMFIIQGKNDRITPMKYAKELMEAMRKRLNVNTAPAKLEDVIAGTKRLYW